MLCFPRFKFPSGTLVCLLCVVPLGGIQILGICHEILGILFQKYFTFRVFASMCVKYIQDYIES